VLGAKLGSGNIGDAIAQRLEAMAMDVYAEDCAAVTGGYGIPILTANTEALVVTLGATEVKPFWEIQDTEIQNIINACLTLPLLAAREFVRARDERGGRIILTGSYAWRHPFSGGAAYCAAKAGLDMAGRTLGWELTGMGYRVFVIHPYHVEGTPMWERVQAGVMATKGMSREQADAYARRELLMDRPLSPNDIAKLVAKLCQADDDDPLMWMSGSHFELFGGTR
jgi:NAD(P)-dependent dehydrogenase (short-subunit alcohol dehydrogenase family)